MDDYLIEFEEVIDISINNFLVKIKETKGKRLDELLVKDLSFHNGNLIYHGTGVYIFREKQEIKVIGKASSMSFTERIPKHFDARPFAWFNRLLALIHEREWSILESPENFEMESLHAFNNYNIVLVHIKPEHKDHIPKVERLLRSTTNALNQFKGLKEDNRQKIVREYVS